MGNSFWKGLLTSVFARKGDDIKDSGLNVKYTDEDGNHIQWLMDGGKAMLEMCDALCRATRFIWIVDAYFSPGINLARGSDYDTIKGKYPDIISRVEQINKDHGVTTLEIPLVSLLAARAEKGVKVRMIIFRPDVAQEKFGGAVGWKEGRQIVHDWSTAIDFQYAMWGGSFEGHELGSHHMKLAVVGIGDKLLAFCGGVDMAYARWALPSHSLSVDGKFPVVLLPGIMGSVMQSGGAQVWPTLKGDQLKRLKINDDGTDFEPGITPGDVIRDFHGVGYKDMIKKFGDAGYKEGDLLFPFAYDWRKSLDDAATELDSKVTQVLAKTGADKVILVAHSMGGLVSRTYAAKGNADKVKRLIMLGTPNHGSPKSYLLLKFGEEGPLKAAGIDLVGKAVYMEVTKNMPGVYQLLPDRQFYSLYNTISGGVFEKGKTYPDPVDAYKNGVTDLPNHALVDESMRVFKDVLGSMSNCDDAYVLIGHNRDTIVKVEVDPAKPTESIRSKASGDETVPMKSAEALDDVFSKKGTHLYYYKGVEHGDLVKTTAVLNDATGLVEDARVQGDPLDLPRRVDWALKIDSQMGWIDLGSVLGEWNGKSYATKGSQVFWHDVHAAMVGPVAADLADNFMERYQNAKSYENLKKASTTTEPDFSWLKSNYKAFRGAEGDVSLLNSPDGYTTEKCDAQIIRSYYSTGSAKKGDYGIYDVYRKLFGGIASSVTFLNDALELRKSRPDLFPDSKLPQDIAPFIKRLTNNGPNVYIESQYAFEDADLLNALMKCLNDYKRLKVIVVAPVMPDSYDGDILSNLKKLLSAGAGGSSPNRVGIYSLVTNVVTDSKIRRVPIYVHAKIAVVDDLWGLVGSANLDRMGMGGKGGGPGSRGSSEIGVLAEGFDQALALRRMLVTEHLGDGVKLCSDIDDFDQVFSAFKSVADGNGLARENNALTGQIVPHRVNEKS